VINGASVSRPHLRRSHNGTAGTTDLKILKGAICESIQLLDAHTKFHESIKIYLFIWSL
jgi:hypothetical protein